MASCGRITTSIVVRCGVIYVSNDIEVYEISIAKFSVRRNLDSWPNHIGSGNRYTHMLPLANAKTRSRCVDPPSWRFDLDTSSTHDPGYLPLLRITGRSSHTPIHRTGPSLRHPREHRVFHSGVILLADSGHHILRASGHCSRSCRVC